ncbi:unnamed protein product [Mytilus coruscus]|uniref:Uncharacterized protein n=1 Tax=Mytilus coruscus TaxID=42192 RepID=A0A6J8DSW3_MYTCO|nr:unnamed protein product [Mytilus coruscus]
MVDKENADISWRICGEVQLQATDLDGRLPFVPYATHGAKGSFSVDFLITDTMKCVLIIALVLCVMVAHVRSQAAGLGPGYGMDTHVGLGASTHSTAGNSNDLFLKYVKLILARIQRLERQQQQKKKQSSGGIHGSHVHGGAGNSKEMLRYVQLILARLAHIEKQQAQQNTASNNGLFGNSGLSKYLLYESLF